MTFPVTSLCSRMTIGSRTTSVWNTSVSRENKAMQGLLMLWRRRNHWLKHFWIIEPGQWDWPEEVEAIQSGEQASRVEAAPGCSTVTEINKLINTVKKTKKQITLNRQSCVSNWHNQQKDTRCLHDPSRVLHRSVKGKKNIKPNLTWKRIHYCFLCILFF